jgi:hypothetical protein
MKWYLLVLACVCVYLTYQLGMQVETVQRGESKGYMNDGSSAATAAAVDMSAGYTGGALGCGIIGATSALGAALIQMSDNRRKNQQGPAA